MPSFVGKFEARLDRVMLEGADDGASRSCGHSGRIQPEGLAVRLRPHGEPEGVSTRLGSMAAGFPAGETQERRLPAS